MIEFTGDTTVKAYTTGARAIVITLADRRHVTFDLIRPEWANATVAQLFMNTINAGLEAGLTTADMDGYLKIFTVA